MPCPSGNNNKKERIRLMPYSKQSEINGRGAIRRLRHSAKNRGIEFDLNLREFKKWWDSTPDECSCCGSTIANFIQLRDYIVRYQGTNTEINKFKRMFPANFAKLERMVVDRIDNTKGYTIDNINKCCHICNSIKGDMIDQTEMELIAPDIISRLWTAIIQG